MRRNREEEPCTFCKGLAENASLTTDSNGDRLIQCDICRRSFPKETEFYFPKTNRVEKEEPCSVCNDGEENASLVMDYDGYPAIICVECGFDFSEKEPNEALKKAGEKLRKFESGARKDLTGKLPYHLIPKEMMDGLAEGLNQGIEKGYEPNNWQKGLPLNEGHIGAALRHIFKWKSGQDLNNEGEGITDINHLSNAMIHLGMALTQIKRGRKDLDDREV